MNKFRKWFKYIIITENWYKCFAVVKSNNRGWKNVYFRMIPKVGYSGEYQSIGGITIEDFFIRWKNEQ